MRTRFPSENSALVSALKSEGLLGQGIISSSFDIKAYNSLLIKHKRKMLIPAKDGQGLMMRNWGKNAIDLLICKYAQEGLGRIRIRS